MSYTFKKFGSRYVVSTANHADPVAVLLQFCQDENIRSGSISGIGAVNEAVLRFFNPATKHYEDKTFSEQMEIAALTGNIAQLNGETYLHVHAVLGRSDYSALAGHLLSAVQNGAGEFVVQEFDGDVQRYFDAGIGLNLYKL